MRILPLTLLVHEGPMARAYLGLLASEGVRPARCIELVPDRSPPGTGRPVGRWLPGRWRVAYAAGAHAHRANHWSRHLWQHESARCKAWWARLGRRYAFDPLAFEPVVAAAAPWSATAPTERIMVSGLDDPQLPQRLRGCGTVLFTGGGRVPDALLATPDCRFLHVHPGVLPEVRGADGLLWSQLLRGRPGASAFLMAPGLDTGDVIATRDFAPAPLPDGFAAFEPAMQYRWLYAFLDPMLRALLLRDLLRTADGTDVGHLPAQRQDLTAGHTFRFMHAGLRAVAMRALLEAAATGGEG